MIKARISELATVTAGAGSAILETPDSVVLATQGVPPEQNAMGRETPSLVTAAQCKTRVCD